MLGLRNLPEVDFFCARLFPMFLDASPVIACRNLVPAVHLKGGVLFVQQAECDVPEQFLCGGIYARWFKIDEYLGGIALC